MRNSLGLKIMRIRLEANISQEELAELVGSDQTRVSFWENGKGSPSNRHMKKLINLGKKYKIVFDLEDLINNGKK